MFGRRNGVDGIVLMEMFVGRRTTYGEKGAVEAARFVLNGNRHDIPFRLF
jgi:hypothetical protein